MKLFSGRRWAGHQLCPTGIWWCCWWRGRQEWPSSAAVWIAGLQRCLWALRLPFVTTKITFSPRKIVTFYLADSLLLTKAASPRVPRRRSWILNSSCFCATHISALDTGKPQNMRNRAVGKRTQGGGRDTLSAGQCDLPTVGEGWGEHSWVHPCPCPCPRPALTAPADSRETPSCWKHNTATLW